MAKEFGSDFQYIDTYQSNTTKWIDDFYNPLFMSNGRQCIIALIQKEKWKRIWIPEYFCYEVINTILSQTNIKIVYYSDYPLNRDDDIIKNLPYREGDVLLRVNYFGIRTYRNNQDLPIPIIEDHSHNIRSRWALHSNADWCIASIRKTLPIPEGGILWSPKGNNHSINLSNTKENKEIARDRWLAMQMKYDYLYGRLLEKDNYRRLFLETEIQFDSSKLSLIDDKSREFLKRFDIDLWQKVKRHNWISLRSLISNKIQILEPENESCNMFSFILLLENKKRRDSIRKKLIESSVYPAILWQVPNKTYPEVQDISNRMLSIHCDGRYNDDEIRQLASIINLSL